MPKEKKIPLGGNHVLIRSAHPKERHAFINLLRPCLSHAVLTGRGNLHMHMGEAVASLPAAKMLIPNHKT